MGYRRRGLSLKELQAEGRRLAAEGGSVRELALIIAEDNFANSMVFEKYKVLSKTSRARILSRVHALSLQDKHLYNYYLSFARSAFMETQRIEETRNAFRRNWTILLYDLNELMTAEHYAELLNMITPTLKEGGVYDTVRAPLLVMRNCWARIEFTEEDGAQKVGGQILSQIKEDAARTRIQLRRYLTYEKVYDTLLLDEELGDFIADYTLDCMLPLKEDSLLPCEKFGERFLKEKELELFQMKQEKAGKVLIKKQEEDIFKCRRYAVFPDKEIVRTEITPEDEIGILKIINNRINDKRQ